MPLTATQLQQLKRTNISVDSEKTRQRAEQLWKAQKIKRKQAVLALADSTSQTVYRIYNQGGISIKMSLALAQELNVSPHYLTGAVDVPGEFTDEAMRELLRKHGYKALLAELQPAEKEKSSYKKREKPADAEEALAASEVTLESQPEAPLLAPVPALPPNSEALTEDDFKLLFHALNIQAKAGIASTKEKFAQIRLVLLT